MEVGLEPAVMLHAVGERVADDADMVAGMKRELGRRSLSEGARREGARRSAKGEGDRQESDSHGENSEDAERWVGLHVRIQTPAGFGSIGGGTRRALARRTAAFRPSVFYFIPRNSSLIDRRSTWSLSSTVSSLAHQRWPEWTQKPLLVPFREIIGSASLSPALPAITFLLQPFSMFSKR